MANEHFNSNYKYLKVNNNKKTFPSSYLSFLALFQKNNKLNTDASAGRTLVNITSQTFL